MRTSTTPPEPVILVSVLMAVRNGARYLPDTLASLASLKTPGEGFEFVLIDDASSDDSTRLLKEFVQAQRDLGRQAILLRRETPEGLASALNHGLRSCSGEFIARADADDLYDSDRLCKQFDAMHARPDIAALSCGYRKIDEHGQLLRTMTPERGSDWMAFQMMFMNSLLHPGVMFRKSVVESLGGYDSNYWTAQDSDLWARLVTAGYKVDNLPEPLVDYRIHETSIVRSRGEAGRLLSLTVPERLQRRYFGEPPPDHDFAATVTLYQGFSRMPPEALRAGLLGLRRIEALAAVREPADVQARFRLRVSRSCMTHARWIRRRSPLLAMKLYCQGRRWQRSEGS